MTDCRIYVADLAAYNSGRLRGEWIDVAGKDRDDINREISAMLANSPESNVTRRKCEECGNYQDARYNDCYACGSANLSPPFPSAEEWAVHDHEGFAGLITSEWPDIGELCAIAEILDYGDDDKRRGLLWLVNDRGYSISDAIDKCGDVLTADCSAEDYAAELASDVYGVTDNTPLSAYIDYERFARDLEIGGDIESTEQDGESFLVTNASEF